MAAPSTPLDRRAASLDPSFSKTSTTAATVGSITPPDVPSPVPFVRQNAFVLEDSQEREVPTEMYPSHTQATPKVAVGDGDGDDPEHNDDEEAVNRLTPVRILKSFSWEMILIQILICPQKNVWSSVQDGCTKNGVS